MLEGLARIEEAIPENAYFEFDLSDETFRQTALRDYVDGWSGRDPFYVRRMGLPAILCTRYRHVQEVLTDPERFVMKAPPIEGFEVFDVFGGLESVLQMDGERHSRVRRLMNPAFSPAGIRKIIPALERIVEQRLDIIAEAGPEFDAMSDFCDHLIARSLLDATFQLSEEQQQAFEQVEVKPQAIEWLFSVAAGSRFHISADNLSGVGAADEERFRHRVRDQAGEYLEQGLPPRAQRFFDSLATFYGTGEILEERWHEDARRIAPLYSESGHSQEN